MTAKFCLQTGQTSCHDSFGREVPCSGSGQDGQYRRGIPWPSPRFETRGGTVTDLLTGLIWTRDANLADFPLTWQEALDYVSEMNRDRAFGLNGWRLPNRRELRSLVSHQTRKPALPEGHHFINVFLGWYWTSTTAAINTAYAWHIHMEGARMFYGHKERFFLLWPVCQEGYGVLPATGQVKCHDSAGRLIPCEGSSHDGEFRTGISWPTPRFEMAGETVIDRLTGLCWLRSADLGGKKTDWEGALASVMKLNSKEKGNARWRLPNINEYESLVDAGTHSPALPEGHPFTDIREGYWSSTTSMFEPDWAWVLYLTKGAIGVGQKRGTHFHAWAVCDKSD